MVDYDYHETLGQLAQRLRDVMNEAVSNKYNPTDPVIATRQANAAVRFFAQAMGIRDNDHNGEMLNDVLNAVPRRFIVTEITKISGPEYCKHASICKHYEQTGEKP
jgi:hypothetical protein